MSPSLIKEARVVIENLSNEIELIKKAQALAFKLHKTGAIVSEDLEEKIAELSQKSKEELDVFEKAAELAQDPNYNFNLGTLSEHPQDDGSMDRLTRMLLNDL